MDGAAGRGGARIRLAGGTPAEGTFAGGALLLSTTAHGARFLAYAVLLVWLARLWPPETFGLFAWHNAAASMVGLAAGWGLSLKVTRDAALAPGGAADVLRSALAAQACLAPVGIILVCCLWSAGLPVALDLVLPLAGAFVCLNLAETVAAACRGVGRFDTEALISTVGNGIFFAAGLGAAIVWSTPVAVAVALLAGRGMHVAIALWAAHRVGLTVPGTRPAPVATLRGGAVFAAESIAAGLFLQIDTVLVALLLGDAAAGAYQAGIRFIVIALVFAQSMAGLFLPALAARLDDAAAFAATARRAVLVFAGYGLVGFVLLLLWGAEIATLLYGSRYQATAALAPLFGALVLMRCVAAGAALVLTAAGEQTWRLCATLTAVTVYLVAALAIGRDHGVGGMVGANLASLAVLALLHFLRAGPRLLMSSHGAGRGPTC